MPDAGSLLTDLLLTTLLTLSIFYLYSVVMLHLKLYETRFVCVVQVVLQMIYIVQKYSLKVQEPHEGWYGRYTIDYTIHS